MTLYFARDSDKRIASYRLRPPLGDAFVVIQESSAITGVVMRTEAHSDDDEDEDNCGLESGDIGLRIRKRFRDEVINTRGDLLTVWSKRDSVKRLS